jgi:hypothetical protein
MDLISVLCLLGLSAVLLHEIYRVKRDLKSQISSLDSFSMALLSRCSELEKTLKHVQEDSRNLAKKAGQEDQTLHNISFGLTEQIEDLKKDMASFVDGRFNHQLQVNKAISELKLELASLKPVKTVKAVKAIKKEIKLSKKLKKSLRASKK